MKTIEKVWYGLGWLYIVALAWALALVSPLAALQALP